MGAIKMDDMTQEQMGQIQRLLATSAQPLVDRYASVIKDMTNPSFILPLLEMDLKRLRETEIDGQIKLVQYGEPLMNEMGVNNILARIRPLLTSNSVLNNLDEVKIEQLMMLLADDLVKELMVMGKTYGIQTNTEKDLIIEITLIPVFLTLNRSLKEGERDFWRNKPPEMQQKPSIFNPFGKGGN
jgi:hypothetical protein